MSNTWCVGRERGERSISTRRNGSLTVRWEKLAGIKKCQIENAYISDSWQPHSPSQIGHKFMIFRNCSCFDTSYFNLENEWEKITDKFFSLEFSVIPCEKLTLNAKRVNSTAHSIPSPFSTLPFNCRICGTLKAACQAIVKSYTFKSTLSWTHEYLYAD